MKTACAIMKFIQILALVSIVAISERSAAITLLSLVLGIAAFTEGIIRGGDANGEK